MKRFPIFALVLTLALSISACGAREVQATPIPTVNPLELQSTMAAAAFTMIAETQAAVPTATPPPPTATFTDTPAETNTPLPLPFAELTLTPPTSASSGGGDPCADKVLPASLKGPQIKMRVNNSTKAALQLSVYLQQTTPQSECGYRAYTLDPGQSVVINDLIQGCYTLWAWNPDPDDYFIVTNGTTCLDTSNNWVFDVTTGSIRLKT